MSGSLRSAQTGGVKRTGAQSDDDESVPRRGTNARSNSPPQGNTPGRQSATFASASSASAATAPLRGRSGGPAPRTNALRPDSDFTALMRVANENSGKRGYPRLSFVMMLSDAVSSIARETVPRCERIKESVLSAIAQGRRIDGIDFESFVSRMNTTLGVKIDFEKLKRTITPSNLPQEFIYPYHNNSGNWVTGEKSRNSLTAEQLEEKFLMKLKPSDFTGGFTISHANLAKILGAIGGRAQNEANKKFAYMRDKTIEAFQRATGEIIVSAGIKNLLLSLVIAVNTQTERVQGDSGKLYPQTKFVKSVANIAQGTLLPNARKPFNELFEKNETKNQLIEENAQILMALSKIYQTNKTTPKED